MGNPSFFIEQYILSAIFDALTDKLTRYRVSFIIALNTRMFFKSTYDAGIDYRIY